MRGNNRKSIEKCRKRLPQFTMMNVIDGQAGLVIYSSLIFYSLTIDNILNIIVLLILAGVSISMLTRDNGIIEQANKAKNETIIATEKEAISLNIINYKVGENSKYLIGTQLYDKNMGNSTIWDIIITKNPEFTYGTDWRYIGKNIEIEDYGKTKLEWGVNYETGEVIKLEEYTRLTHDMHLGVTDGLIFNIDPSIIENTDIEELKNGNTSILGNNVELVNFDWNENSGSSSTEFNFDGNNDYIKVKYNEEKEKDVLAKRGFAFEYYGTINKGTSFDNKAQQVLNYPQYTGIFGYWNGEKLYEGNYNKQQWDEFVNIKIKELNYFLIGRCSMTEDGYWHYSKMNTYACRLYNKPLTPEEVKDNYDKSVAYHENITK